MCAGGVSNMFLRVDFNGHGQSVSDTRPRRVQGVSLSDTDTGWY